MSIVRPYDIQALELPEQFSDGIPRTYIYIFAIDTNQDTYVIRLEDFRTYVYIELPPFDMYGEPLDWTDDIIERFVGSFKSILKETLIDYKLVSGKKLYYYQPVERQFLKVYLTSQSTRQMYLLSKRLESTYTFVFNDLCVGSDGKPMKRTIDANFTLHEHNIKPVCKFLAEFETSPCEPLDLTGLEPVPSEKRESDPRFVNREYHLTAEQYQAARKLASYQQVPIAHPRILVFDIECYSSSPNRMPQRHEIKDEIFAISCTLMTGPGESQEYMITTGESKPIEGLVIIKASTELELLHQFLELITKLNPHVISGYNIHGFDLQYLHERLEKVYLEQYPELSMLKGRPVVINDYSGNETRAFGHLENFVIPMIGRIYFDLYTYMRKNYKFPKYNLDYVAEQMLGSHKEDMPYKEMFAIFKRLKEQGPTEANIDDFTRVVSYCVQDSRLVVQMFDELHIWIELLETANIVQVPIEHLYLRGQQVRCVNQIYKLAHNRGYVIDKRISPDVPYTGGFVGTPVVGLHDQVACLDFASLYPSIIMAYNICYTTLVRPSEVDEYNDISQEIAITHDESLNVKAGAKVSNATYRYRFVHKESHPGLLPELVSTLVSVRRQVRKESEAAFAKAKESTGMEAMRYQLEGIVLNKRQLALKVSANSLYGFLGVRNNGQLPLIEGAMSITSLGRQLINGANRDIEARWGYKIIYNDTDSTMFMMHDVSKEQMYERAEEIAKEINKGFHEPLRLELEKVMIGFFLKKKNYCYLIYNRDGTLPTRNGTIDTRDIIFKGMKPVRRENCQLLKDLYSRVILQVFQRAKFKDVASMLIDEYERLILGLVPVDRLIMYLSMGEYAADSTYYLKGFKERVINLGYNVNTGDRVGTLLVKRPECKKVSEQLVLIDEYDKGGLEIDGYVYLVNKIAPAIDQILEVAYQRIIQRYPNIAIKLNRCKPIHFVLVGTAIGCGFLKYKPKGGIDDARMHYEKVFHLFGDITSF